MEPQSPDPGAATDVTHSRTRLRGARLRLTFVAVLSFTLGGLIVAAAPLVRSWIDSRVVVRAFVRIQPREYWIASPLTPLQENVEYLRHFKQPKEGFLTSDRVLYKAFASPQVQRIDWLKQNRHPLQWMREHLQIDAPESSQWIALSIHDARPDEQTALLNAMTDAYLDTFLELYQSLAGAELKRIKAECARSREELAAQRTSLLEVEEKGDAVKAAALRDEIAVKEGRVRRLLSAIEEMNPRIESPSSTKAPDAN